MHPAKGCDLLWRDCGSQINTYFRFATMSRKPTSQTGPSNFPNDRRHAQRSGDLPGWRALARIQRTATTRCILCEIYLDDLVLSGIHSLSVSHGPATTIAVRVGEWSGPISNNLSCLSSGDVHRLAIV